MRRSNWLWPLVLLLIAGLLIAVAAGAVPAPVLDLAGRAWPILLIILGFNMLVGRRVRFGNVFILMLSIALTAGVVVTAYSKQAAVLRTDYTQNVLQAVPADARALRVTVNTLLATVEIGVGPGRTVSGQFTGSTESQFASSFTVTDGVATLSLIELRPNAVPQLAAIGRGQLLLTLPANVTIDTLTVRGGQGDLTLNLQTAPLRTIDARIGSGALIVNLPALPPQSALAGSLRTDGGDLTLNVPPGLTLKLSVESGRPVFDPANYLALQGGIVQSAGVRDFQAVLSAASSGSVNLK
jgi:hypothetical protein